MELDETGDPGQVGLRLAVSKQRRNGGELENGKEDKLVLSMAATHFIDKF